MNKTGRMFFAVVSLCSLLLTGGCNFLEGFDKGMIGRDASDLASEGELALERGDYVRALELFEGLVEDGDNTRKTRLGYAEALAGSAGFNLLSVLNALQNTTGPYDIADVLFRTVGMITDRARLEKAWSQLRLIADLDRPDYIFRGLIPILLAVDRTIEKYDANKNRRIDKNDRVGFYTNDQITENWPIFYSRLAGSPGAPGILEHSFLDLTKGFDGRGDQWTFISPVSDKSHSGSFSTANRQTILAVSDLVERLKKVDEQYERDLAAFSLHVRNLDGEN